LEKTLSAVSMSEKSHNSEVNSHDRSRQAGAAFGLGIGALIMTTFGFVWLGWGFSAAQRFPVAGWIIFYLVFLALLAAGIRAIRKGRALMKVHPVPRDDSWVKTNKQFKIITILEGVGCGLVVLLTNVFHRMDLLAAGISLVVGLHFLPLAGLFRFNAYYAVGIAIIAGDVLSCALFRGDAITLSVGVATGTILWVTSIYALLRSGKFLGHGGALGE
jgi:hypothetical protein